MVKTVKHKKAQNGSSNLPSYPPRCSLLEGKGLVSL